MAGQFFAWLRGLFSRVCSSTNSPTVIRFRPATLSDASRLFLLRFADGYANLNATQLWHSLGSDNCASYVAVAEGASSYVIGLCVVQLNGSDATVIEFMVDKTHAGDDVGRRFFNFVRRRISLVFDVGLLFAVSREDRLPLLRFYSDMGGRPVTLPEHFPEFGVDGVMFTWRGVAPESGGLAVNTDNGV